MAHRPKQYGGKLHGGLRRGTDRRAAPDSDRELEEQGRQATPRAGEAPGSRMTEGAHASEAAIWERQQDETNI